MKNTRYKLVLFLILVLTLTSTIGYAYTWLTLGSRVLSIGMVGGDVQELQIFLNSHNYPVGPADGIFGSKTRNGVINFQKDHGPVADGIVGKQTLQAINNLKNKTEEGYTVKPGDTLYNIAVKNGVTVDLLKRSNGLKSDVIYPGQVLVIPKNNTAPDNQTPIPPQHSSKPLAQVLHEMGINAPIPNLKIVVDKSDHLLTMYSGSTPLKSYHAALGDNGLGPKQKAGDHKTPEGNYYIAERSVLSPPDQYLGSRWMRVSYPNINDAERGLNQGLIDYATYQQIVNAINKGEIPPQHTPLGGGIGIHGGSNNGTNAGDSWTWGCIGLTNSDVNEIYDYIGVGTRLLIQY